MRAPRIGFRSAAPLLLVAGLAAAGVFLLLRKDTVRAGHPPTAADRLPPGTETFVVFSLEPDGETSAPAWVAKAWEYVPSRPDAGLTLRCTFDEALGAGSPVAAAPELVLVQAYRLIRADPTRSRNPLTAAVRRPVRDIVSRLYAIDYRTWEARPLHESDTIAFQSSDGGRIRLSTGEGPWVHDRPEAFPAAIPDPLPDPAGPDPSLLPGEMAEYRQPAPEPGLSNDPARRACDTAHAFLGWNGLTAAVPGTGGRSSVAFSHDGRRFLLGTRTGPEGNRFFDGDLETGALREIPCPAEGLRLAEELVIAPVRCP